MRRVLSVLRAAEAALAEGNSNCGGEPDNVYYEPLREVREEIARLTEAAPRLATALGWLTGPGGPETLENAQEAALRLGEL